MEVLWQTEIIVNIFLQSLGDWLVPFMRFFSFLGQEETYILIVPFLYWCVDVELALRFILVLLASAYSNAILKLSFHGARPYWLDSRVLPLSSEKTFGMPSGHAQNAAGVWGVMACYFKNKPVKALLIALIFLIGFSRLYLGVHFTSDVFAGWIIGSLLLLAIFKLEPLLKKWFNAKSMLFQLLFLCGLSLIMLFAGLGWIGIQSRVPIPDLWMQNTAGYNGIQPVAPYMPNDIVSFSGIFLGITTGYIWVKHRMTYDPSKGTKTQKAMRLFIGLLGTMLVVYGLGSIFPFSSSSGMAGIVSRYLRYALNGIWMTGLAPFLFRKLKII